MNALAPDRLARFATRHPWRVVAGWAIFLVSLAGLGFTVGGSLTTDMTTFATLEAQTADELIKSRMHDGASAGGPAEYVLFQHRDLAVDDAAFRATVEAVADELRALPGAVAGVVSFYETGEPSLVSRDRHTLLMPVATGWAGKPEENAKPILEVLAERDGAGGFTVVTGGEGSSNQTFIETSEKDLQKAELIGLPFALVVLVVVFGALMAAGIPIVLSLLAILGAVASTLLIGRAFDLSIFATNVITMIGLAVGIDYALLIIQRFREERRKGRDRDGAIIRADSTASRSVLFSGMAVVVALAGLFIVPTSIFRSIAVGAIIVVVFAVAAALTLLPAVLRLMGDRVNLGTVRLPRRSRSKAASGGGFWTWTTNLVMKHAVVSVVVSAGLLVAASLPYFTIRLGNSGVSSLPDGSSPRRAFTILEEEFNSGLLTPTKVVIDARDVNGPAVQGAVERLRVTVAGDPAFFVQGFTANAAGDTGELDLAIQGEAQSKASLAALERLREEYIPAAFAGTDAKVYVGGETAWAIDFGGLIDRYTPWVFSFVLGLSFVILLVVFRSIVVPLKAIVMNLLSVGAAYGLMVTVFQHGHGAGLLGFSQVERIDAWVPLFMFAILFGLSMDYHVFLLSRIKEQFDATHDDATSVAHGVRTTAGMITGAALIMVAVFTGFTMGELVMMQQMGFGLAVAVFLDATIVRTVLVPASMELLGERNWYLPSWLGWLPRINVEGHSVEGRGHVLPEGAPAGGQ
ncbi:MAG: MMPL family transporter [Dehalococcoidia bacterium]|nr:MMPL family transporter [Dehalococcoidia bacterium]